MSNGGIYLGRTVGIKAETAGGAGENEDTGVRRDFVAVIEHQGDVQVMLVVTVVGFDADLAECKGAVCLPGQVVVLDGRAEFKAEPERDIEPDTDIEAVVPSVIPFGWVHACSRIARAYVYLCEGRRCSHHDGCG